MGGVETLGFIHTKYINASEDWPDVEIHFVSGSHVSDGGQTFQRVMGVSQQVQMLEFDNILLNYVYNKVRNSETPRDMNDAMKLFTLEVFYFLSFSFNI